MSAETMIADADGIVARYRAGRVKDQGDENTYPTRAEAIAQLITLGYSYDLADRLLTQRSQGRATRMRR